MEEEADIPSDKASSDDLFEITWTEAEEKRVRNKLDWQIVCQSHMSNRCDTLADLAFPRYLW